MEVQGLADAGLALATGAQQLADEAAQRLVSDPSAPAEPLVDLNTAEHEAQLAARLLRAHDEMTGTLLDVLA